MRPWALGSPFRLCSCLWILCVSTFYMFVSIVTESPSRCVHTSCRFCQCVCLNEYRMYLSFVCCPTAGGLQDGLTGYVTALGCQYEYVAESFPSAEVCVCECSCLTEFSPGCLALHKQVLYIPILTSHPQLLGFFPSRPEK